MAGNHVFCSHTSADDGIVKALRGSLGLQGMSLWDDARYLRGGDVLRAEIETAIEEATAFLVVLGPQTLNSEWVLREVRFAREVARQRSGFRIVPLLLDGVTPSALKLWFNDDEPVAVRIPAGDVQAALPEILTALGLREPDDRSPIGDVAPTPLAELILELRQPSLMTDEGQRRARAEARLVYRSPRADEPQVEGSPFRFTAPLTDLGSLRLA
jgi:hypothetical protein